MFALGFLHQTSQASRHNGLFNLKHNFHLLRRYCHSKCRNRWCDYGDGSDGALTVSSGTAYTDALRTGVTGTNAAGGNTLTVASSSGFAVGDEIIIITMVDAATSGNTVGQHEFNIITAISGNTFTLAAIKSHSLSMLRARKYIRPLRYLTILMFLFLQALYLLVIHGMAPQEAFCALEQTAR